MSRAIAKLVLVGAALSACAGISTDSEYDPAVDFSAYSTFAQAPPPEGRPKGLPGWSSITDRLVQREIAEDLEQKGFRSAPRESADLMVAFTVSGEPRTDVWGNPGWGWAGGGTVTTSHYVRGVLAIDIYERRRQKLVWRGWATKDVFAEDSRADRVEQAVQAVLEQFPPQRASN